MALAGILALSVSPAAATIISVTPTGGSTGVLVVNNACDDEFDGPSLTITGCLNNDHTSAADVDFRSTENIEFGNGGGQATVLASDGLAQTLTIDPRNFLMGQLIVDINSSIDGFVQFCDNNACFPTLLALDDKGSNFFDIHFDPGADFLRIETFGSNNLADPEEAIENTKQWRVAEFGAPPCTSNCGGTEVPEPNSLAILGVGLLGLAYIVSRRRRHT